MVERLRNKFDANKPILLKDIKEEYSEYSRPRVFQLIKQAVENEELKRFDSGIYYIPTTSYFGTSKLNTKEVIERIYITDNEEVYGYYSGLTFLNLIVFSEQVPNTIEIVTNSESTRVRNVTTGNQSVRLRKPRTKVNRDNYKVLQLLDFFNNVDLLNYKDMKDYILAFIEESGIITDDIFKYAKFYPAKAIKNFILY